MVLHIITQPGDSLASDIIERQRDRAEAQLEIVVLQTELRPDYEKLVGKIFEADSVAVW